MAEGLVKPKEIYDVYVADYIEIDGAKSKVSGNVINIKNQFRLSEEQLYKLLVKYLEEGKIQIKYKLDNNVKNEKS